MPPAPNPLSRLIRLQIEEDGPLPFDRFMEYALYHPEHGYYGADSAPARAGPQGDFVTAPTLSPLYGRALARFLAAAWERLGRPPSWWYAEAGAGAGALARPVVQALREEHGGAAHGLHVALTDLNPAHRAAARLGLAEILPENRLHVEEEFPSFGGRPVVIVANELLDNLPVRLLYQRAEGWMERCVGIDAHGFTWVDRPADQAQIDWVQSFGIQAPPDHQVEMPVGAASWLEDLDRALGDTRAVLLLVDYGETARDLVGEPRHAGTLMAYEGHQQDRDVLRHPGTRDITAHVNWTAVAQMAKERGWRPLGYTTQTAFLMGLGLVDDAARLGANINDERAFAALQAVKEVLLPGGMGETFKVLALARGLAADTDSWPGLSELRDVAPPPRG